MQAVNLGLSWGWGPESTSTKLKFGKVRAPEVGNVASEMGIGKPGALRLPPFRGTIFSLVASKMGPFLWLYMEVTFHSQKWPKINGYPWGYHHPYKRSGSRWFRWQLHSRCWSTRQRGWCYSHLRCGHERWRAMLEGPSKVCVVR